MEILNQFIQIFSIKDPEHQEFDRIINQAWEESRQKFNYFWDLRIKDLSIYQEEVVHWPDKKKIDFAIECMRKIHFFRNKNHHYSTSDPKCQKATVRHMFVQHLFLAKLSLEESDIQRIINAFSKYRSHYYASILAWPMSRFLNKIAHQYKGRLLSNSLKETLNNLRKKIAAVSRYGDDKEKLKFLEKIDLILYRSLHGEHAIKPTLFHGKDPFVLMANKQIKSLDQKDKEYWYQLIGMAQKVNGARPGKRFQKNSRDLIKEYGDRKFKKIVNAWFSFLVNLKETLTERKESYGGESYTYYSHEFIDSSTIQAVKGFVWMCTPFYDSHTLQNLANLAERSYRKVPGHGPVAQALGNACFYALAHSKGIEGISHLSRLKLKIKQNSAQKIIKGYLSSAAIEKGISVHEMEDISVEDFGLVDGNLETAFGEYTAILTIKSAGKTTLQWIKADGSRQKTIPSFVKNHLSTELKKLKLLKKQIDKTSSAQKDRIDQMFRAERSWSFEKFMEYYFDHGLMSFLTKKLIWNFKDNEEMVTAIFYRDHWTCLDGQLFIPKNDCEVSLWHPAQASTEEVRLWRDFLMDHEIKQPIKQAYREVYLLTEAELNTKTYSNRMAAHILKQHQYVSLAKGRGWKARLLGAWDGGYDDIAELDLPEYKLKAQFWIQSLDVEDGYNGNGIWNYITTDQIRFINTEVNEYLDLIDVPAVPFSEVLRDVDLFVGVASVGNDPSWRDSGGLPAYRDYWNSYSFGSLSALATNRKEVLEKLLPRLKIKNVAEIQDKFLLVKGKYRKYKIHLGSTNILMEPNDQYLCIVPDRSKKDPTEKLFIPFEGDTGLSIILSKAFLLAEDDKIKDKTITSQIHRS